MNSGLDSGDRSSSWPGIFLSFFSSRFQFLLRVLLTLPWGDRNVSLKVTGVMPGDHGSTFIDLHNNGTERGLVYLWVDNISSSDRNGIPGGLANYLYFDVSHKNLMSTVILPAHIHPFPQLPCCRTILSSSIH